MTYYLSPKCIPENIFFFYIIYDYYHYDIIISDSSSYKSVGIHWTIVFNISI